MYGLDECADPITRNIKCCDGNGKSHYYGRWSDQDDVANLLDRIDWLAKNNNLSRFIIERSYVIGFVTMLAISFAIYNKFLSVHKMVIIIFAVMVIVISVSRFFDFHGGEYPKFYIRDNIRRIRAKLDLKPGRVRKPCHVSRLPFRTVMNEIINR
jgi:hypothetical protein